MAILYFYLAAVQGDGRSPWPGRWLGLALTLLFVFKYNYWLLTVFAIGVDVLLNQRLGPWSAGLRAVWGFNYAGWIEREARKPSSWLLFGWLMLVLLVYLRGPVPLDVLGTSVSIYPPYTIINIAYAIYLFRLVLWWRGAGGAVTAQLAPWARSLPAWHAWPVAVWFVLPKHLGYFLWFVSPTNAGNRKTQFLEGLTSFFDWLGVQYHAGQAEFVVVLALFAVAVLLCWRMRPGGQAVLWLALLGFVLNVMHPNQKARYMHSWSPALWAGAGAGLALLLCSWAALARLRPALAATTLTALALALGPAIASPGRAPEGGPHPSKPSVLELTEYYLPELDDSHQATVLSGISIRPLAEWTYMQRYGSLDHLEKNWYGWGGDREANREGFVRWIQTTNTDTIVWVEQRPGPLVWERFVEDQRHWDINDLLKAQTVFHKVKEREFPHLSCAVAVWKRVSQ
jgi:hypothetical protein